MKLTKLTSSSLTASRRVFSNFCCVIQSEAAKSLKNHTRIRMMKYSLLFKHRYSDSINLTLHYLDLEFHPWRSSRPLFYSIFPNSQRYPNNNQVHQTKYQSSDLTKTKNFHLRRVSGKNLA